MGDMGLNPFGGRHNSSADFNLNTITTTQLYCKQASSQLQDTYTATQNQAKDIMFSMLNVLVPTSLYAHRDQK